MAASAAAATVVSSSSTASEVEDKVDPEVELIHVKWPQTASTTDQTTATADLQINSILSSWTNPVFKYAAEPCHATTTSSRLIS